MNKKSKVRVLMISAALVAVSLFTVTAFASTPNHPGYAAFKEVLKADQMSEEAFESATVNGNLAVTVDDEKVVELEGATKVEEAGEEPRISSDFTFTLMGVERSGSLYNSEDQSSVYFVDRTHDLHYQVMNVDEEHDSKHHKWEEGDAEHRSMNKAEEALLDYAVGDLKDDFSVAEHTDGTKTITVDISKEEVPLPVRLLLDVVSSQDHNERSHAPEVSAEWAPVMEMPFFQELLQLDLNEQLPQLTEELAIEHVQLQLTVDGNNQVQRVQGGIEWSGKDESGVTHRVAVEGDVTCSDINTTTPDVYDPAGKSINIIDAATFDKRG